jgi:TonB-dependent receptor
MMKRYQLNSTIARYRYAFVHTKASDWLRMFCIASGVFLTVMNVHAQSSVGSIEGRVMEFGTGRSLEGAIVEIANTTFRDYTDATGRYLITGIPAGEYEVNVRYVGLEATSGSVVIAQGQATSHNVNLTSQWAGIENITVRASQTGGARAINQQKTAAGIVNIISEEAFGAMVDGNIGQAMQRLPGISVDEDQDGSPGSINIRGVSGEYNSVQIDGNRVPSSGGSNAFNARQLAADGVTTIEVIKAPTPDRDGDAVGGIINLVTRSAFQRSGRETSVDLVRTLNEESDNWGYSANVNFSDIFSVNGGDNNLGISFSLSSYDTDRYSINADQDWVQVDPATNPELNLDGYARPVWFMESTHFEHDTRETNTTTLNGSIDFKVSEDDSFYLRPLVSFYERGGFKYETDIDIDTAFENEAGGDKTYAELTPNYGRGTADSEASRGWIGTLEDIENKLYSLAFGGRHELKSSLLNYDISYSSNKSTIHNDSELNMLMEPDDPWFIFEYEIYDPRGQVRVDVVNGVDSTDLSLMTEGELIDAFGTKEEKAVNGKIDWERSFSGNRGVFTLKTGAKYRESSQFRDMTANAYEMDEDFPYANVLVPTNEVVLRKPKYFDAQPQVGLAMLQSNPELFEFVEDASLEDSNIEDYDAKETIAASYLMGTYETGIHTIIAGLRFERYEWDNKNKIVSFLDDVATVTPVNNGNSHLFVLPGIHFRHALSDNLILRESYNRSYARPRLEELSRGRWIDDDGNIEDGNSKLKPAVSDNFDIQLEYYTDRGGLYSIGYFYKDISDFTYTQTYDFDVLNADGIPIPDEDGDLEYERPLNGTNAKNTGFELIARQGLYFLPGAWQGFGVAVSATFTDSEADYPNRTDRSDLSLEGFSDKLYTVTLDYNWSNLSARIDYRYRDEYIEGLGSDIESDEFYAAEERVDGEVHYRVGDNLLISTTVTNLTERPQVSYQGYPRFVEDASYSGRKYTFGMRYDF